MKQVLKDTRLLCIVLLINLIHTSKALSQNIFDAIQQGNIELVKNLLNQDLDINNATNPRLWTPLHTAVSRNNLEIVEILIESGANVNAKDDVQFTPLLRGVMANASFEILKLLLENDAEIDPRAICIPLSFGKAEIPKMLLSHGADISYRTEDGETFLHLAAERENVDGLILFIEKGISNNAKDDNNLTPLHIASFYGNIKNVEYLISSGADINSISNIYGSPLHLAMVASRKSVIEVLLSKNAKDIPGRLPELKGEYLGMEVPGIIPELFAPQIMSYVGSWLTPPTFSLDHNEIYWSISAPHGASSRIYTMKKEGVSWSSPKAIAFSPEFEEFNPFYSCISNKLLFASKKALLSEGIEQSRKRYYWVAEKDGDTFEQATYLDSVINSRRNEFHISLSRNGNIYFSGNWEDGSGGSRIYYSKPTNSGFTQPIMLKYSNGSAIRSSQPAIAPDESYIIFLMAFQKENYSFFDLYVSFNNYDGTWSDPINLGENINKYNCKYPKISSDGKYVFFTSDNKTYWVSSDVIEQLSH